MENTLILGVGNLLLSDDGVGVRVIQKLEARPDLPASIRLLDGGTCGLDLLQYLDGVENLVVVDAADFGELPGVIHRIEGASIPGFLEQKISPHEISLPELLFSARLIGIYPQRVVILGIQPASLAVGMELTPHVAARVDQLAAMALAEASREVEGMS